MRVSPETGKDVRWHEGMKCRAASRQWDLEWPQQILAAALRTRVRSRSPSPIRTQALRHWGTGERGHFTTQAVIDAHRQPDEAYRGEGFLKSRTSSRARLMHKV